MIPEMRHFMPLTRLVMKWRERADARSLRARCEAILRDLFIPNPFDEQAFCAALAVRRGRPIVLQALPLRAMTTRSVIYGLVIGTPACDIIIYERDTSHAHQRQIIVHESCHLIFNHRSTPLPEHALPEPLEATRASCSAFGKPNHTEAEEHEAEVLASLILEQVAIGIPSGGRDPDAEATAMTARLAAFYRLKGGV